MDEQRLHEIGKELLDLEELESALAEDYRREQAAEQQVLKGRRWPYFGLVSISGIAAVLLFVLWPRDFIEQFSVSPVIESVDPTRGGVEPEKKIPVTLTLRSPAYVRYLLLDDRFRVWAIPFNQKGSITSRFDGSEKTTNLPLWPASDKSMAVLVFVVVTPDPNPELDAYLEGFNKPLSGADSSPVEYEKAAKQFSSDLRKRFSCLVSFQLVP